MKELYENNKDFKEYVDRYCREFELTVDEALTHAMVKCVAESYGGVNDECRR